MSKYVCSVCGEPTKFNSYQNRHVLNCSCAKQRVWVSDDKGGRMTNLFDAKPVKEDEMGEKRNEVAVIKKIKRSKKK